MTRRARLAAVFGVLAAVGALGVGQAAQLPVTPTTVTVLAGQHPCPGNPVVATTPPSTAAVSTITVTAPAGCGGSLLRVAVGEGAAVVQGSVTAPGTAPVVLTLSGSYTPTTSTVVAATVSGWHSPVSWSYTPPPAGPQITCTTSQSARPCEAEVVLRNNHVWETGYDLDITIRDTRGGNAQNPVEWMIEIDFAHNFYPWVPDGIDGSGVVAQSGCAELPVLKLTGRKDWGEHHQLRKGDVRTVWIQPHNTGSGNLLSCG